ncbi:MAG: hypothetical protein U1E70_11565 [Acetobacteraceae bacterium]|nr:hypothetical protein [Pseudomonadota bacterium]
MTATLLLGSLIALSGPAAARDLLVGPTRAMKLPSQAAAAAKPGDVIIIDPGEYRDCAVWRASDITIRAAAPQVVLAEKTCEAKGIFVVTGNNVTVDGITFREAAVPDRNGAGIRVSGENLTVLNSRFERNENGILAVGSDKSILRISNSAFIGNGSCVAGCAHGVYAGAPIGLLEIDNCRFLATRDGHHIKSRALRTVIRNSRIEDGLGGTSSYLVETAQGGDLLIEKTMLQKGPNSGNRRVAISIATEGTRNPTNTMVIKENYFRTDVPGGTTFVRNAAQVPVQLIDNRISGDAQPLQGAGSIIP